MQVTGLPYEPVLLSASRQTLINSNNLKHRQMTDKSTSKMAYDGMLTAGRIALKWESYRDSVKRFYMIDKEKGESEYKERMILLQSIIKKYAEKHGIEQLQAIIDIGNKEEGMLALQFLAAGFELISGNDFTDCS